MNKNFEKEYRKKIQEEVPDLWYRIEEGLIEKNAEVELSKYSAKAKKIMIYKYSSLAAACICLAIILPVLIFSGKNYKECTSGTDMAEKSDETLMEEAMEADAEGSGILFEFSADEPAVESTEEYAEGAGNIQTSHMKVMIQDYTKSETSSIYKIIVEEDYKNEFVSGTEIEMEADESLLASLENGKVYEIEFYYDSTKNIPYQIIDITETY